MEDTASVDCTVNTRTVSVMPCRLIKVTVLSPSVELMAQVSRVKVDPSSVEKNPAPITMLLTPTLDVVRVEPTMVEKNPLFKYMEDTVAVEVTMEDPFMVE